MALLVARFCRFYAGFNYQDVMKMPARAFFVMNAKIPRIQAEEEVVALTVTHHGKPGERIHELTARIKKARETGMPAAGYVIDNKAGEAGYEAVPGEIAAQRERQRQQAEQIRKDQKAWYEKLKQQQLQKMNEQSE